MPSILILNQDPQGTHDGLGFPFEWSPVQSEGDPQLLQLLQLLQVDVFWGSESGASIWPWCHLEDYVRLALTCQYFAFVDIANKQLNEIRWCVWWHNEEALLAAGMLIPGTPESPSDLHVPLVDLEEDPDGLGFPFEWSPVQSEGDLQPTSPPM